MNNKVLKNTFWIVGCKIIKAVLTLLITIFTARYFGPSNYGLINYAASLVTFVSPFVKLGFDCTIVYELINNKDEEGKILGTSICSSLISSFLCILGIASFVYVSSPNDKVTFIVCTLYSLVLIFQSLELIQYWFQSKLLSKYSSIAMVISYLVMSMFQFLLLYYKKNVCWFALANSIDVLIISLILYYFYFKMSKNKLQFSMKTFFKMFKKSKHYIISAIMVTIFAQTDIIMLKFFLGNDKVGIYSAAIACTNIFSFVFSAIVDSYRPIIFESKKKNELDYNNNMVKLYSIVIYLSFLISLATSFLSPLIIKIMYGVKYIESIPVLRFVVFYTTFSYLGSVRNIWIMAEKKEKYLWRINLIGAVTNVILNAILIPKCGVIGAAIASFITQFFTNFVLGMFMKNIRANNKLIIKSLNVMILVESIKSIIDLVNLKIKRKEVKNNE